MREFSSALWVLPSLFALTHSESLPYNPTTILATSSSSWNADVAYIFLEASESNAQQQLVSLNISTTISASNLSIEILSPSLPFVIDDSTAFIPSISLSGEISVYAGSCAVSSSSELWRFSPSNTSTTGNGTWAKETTTMASAMSANMLGADFLSSGFSFSTFVNANASLTDIYVFGGMCPTSGATTSTWQSSASYSNNMLKLSPSSSSNTGYTIDLASSRSPPIAEAGFSVTGLTPTGSNSSGVLTQQQNFVLLGGHTQTAFINMSQVAVWSLPEESWSFVTIDSPSSSSSANTELTVKSTASSVDSRSGHSAVLTEDGTSIIVFGGWVGDVTQAADPQLAVLSLGSGFGGTGDWVWSIPSGQPTGPGIYGHGAVMLPGNVMMVIGGYNISTSTSSKREVSSAPLVMFFNTTSMSWTSNYTNPAYVAAVTGKAISSTSANSNSKKVGLGAGLGLGFAAILGALAVYIWYNRRLKLARIAEREKELRSLSMDAADYSSLPRREMGQRGGAFPWSKGRWNSSGGDQGGHIYDSMGAVAGYENLLSGVHGLGDYGGVPPAPRQIPRKPLYSRNARGLYQVTPTFEFNAAGNHGRANSLGTAGPIHPIYEADEDQSSPPIDTGDGDTRGDHISAPRANPYSDCFEIESPARSREREIQEWVSDWAAAEALLNSQAKSHSQAGRLSPTRRAQLIAVSSVSSLAGEEDSGRTASNLSERSVAASAMSLSRSGSSSQNRSRSNSLRGFISNTLSPFTILSTTVTNSTISPGFDGPASMNNQPPRSAGSGSSSFTTAQTSFPTLKAEGESLLPRPDELASGESSPTRSGGDPSGSPSKSKAPALGKGLSQLAWLGSLKRVFVGSEAGSCNNSRPDTPSFATREPSPVRIGDAGIAPRRTVSAGATLLRRKQGKGDWEDSAGFDPGMPGRSNTFTGEAPRMESSSGIGDDEDDWDIERAVENRVVQVMFTVPKERLRVVNHDFGEDGSDVGSLRSKKGSDRSSKAVRCLESASEKDVERSPEMGGQRKSKVREIVDKMEGRSNADDKMP